MVLKMAPSTPDPPMRLLSISDGNLDSPFPELEIELSEDDVRETAYEIFVAACGHTALSARTQASKHKIGMTSFSTHRLRTALTLGKDKAHHPASHGRKPPTTAEIVQYQMRITDDSDDRIRRALLRAFTGQIGKPIEAILVPLELLQNCSASQFSDPSKYERWRKRQLRVLEAGLIVYPAVSQAGGDRNLSSRLQRMLTELAGNSGETGKGNEAWSALRAAAIAKAGRTGSSDSPSGPIHWADGFPLNVHLYLALLSSCFDILEESVLIAEVDDVLEMMKKTWGILGVNQMLHNLCFMWILFRQFVATEQVEASLLVAAEEHIKEVASDPNVKVDFHAEAFHSALSIIQAWAEQRLLAYHETFPRGADGVMEAVLSLGLSAGRILEENMKQGAMHKQRDLSNFESTKVEQYIRSSLKAAFAQMMETADTRRRSFKNGNAPRPALMVLATDIGLLADEERSKFSTVLKRWHTCAGGVAAATLHSCFGREYSQFVNGLTGMTPDNLQVLQAADKLEKELVQTAVEDAVDADDGGKGLMREMQPFEAESVIDRLSKKWLQEALAHLLEWVDRNIQNEQWKPKATRECFAASSVEVLRIIEETMDCFFSLPISKEALYLEQLVSGVEGAIQLYCRKTLDGCEDKKQYIPSLPALTRYSTSALQHKGSWRPGLHSHKSKTSSQLGLAHKGSALINLCVRINTLHHIQTEVQYIQKRLKYGWKDGPSTMGQNGRNSPLAEGDGDNNFRYVGAEVDKGVQLLIELAAYRVVFHDLQLVFWEGLYAGGVENARISQVMEQLDPELGTIADTVSESLRNRIVGALMKASIDCLTLVLLAGGPSRAFSIQDADVLEEDLTALIDLFTADGEGLPNDLVQGAAAQVRQVLTLFHTSSEKLIETLRTLYPEADQGTSSRFKSAPLPRTTGDWGPSDANTILRVLCYRADRTASKYLKKAFNIPKKLTVNK